MIKPVGLEAQLDLKLVADGPLPYTYGSVVATMNRFNTLQSVSELDFKSAVRLSSLIMTQKGPFMIVWVT